MTKYIVTYKPKRMVRRIAMLNGNISKFSTKRSALKRAKEYDGLNARVAKLKW